MPFQTMGILNLTPDSFSDGGECFSPQSFLTKTKCLLHENNISILDIGFESTAPFNSKVSLVEELKRVDEIFVPSLKYLIEEKDSFDFFSVDTYKLEVFKTCFFWIKEFFPEKGIIWNDISGKLDDECLNFLSRYQDIHYILCHNLAADRDSSSDHRDYTPSLSPQENLISMIHYFQRALERWYCAGLSEERLWLDPAFGFSKTAQMDWHLIKHFPSLLAAFPKTQKWVVGISRKSFFNTSSSGDKIKRPLSLEEKEFLHFQILHHLVLENPSNELIFRVHNPQIPGLISRYIKDLPAKGL